MQAREREKNSDGKRNKRTAERVKYIYIKTESKRNAAKTE